MKTATSAFGRWRNFARTLSRLCCKTQLQPPDDIKSCIFIFTHARDQSAHLTGHLIAVPDIVTAGVSCPWFATETHSKAPDAVCSCDCHATRRLSFYQRYTELNMPPWVGRRLANILIYSRQPPRGILGQQPAHDRRVSAAVWCPTTYQLFVKANLSPLFSVSRPCQ